ncbi:hypothetical protein [Gaetbulibacter aestuarii]|uniref:Uncharacterized protein n=1 Tax=Gaetbulibacter aestuarii TaxID=1502358 RepID=A0ABW7MYF5_9FLAO
MKKLIYLLPIFLILFTCNNKDNVNDTNPETFLEQFENTVWLSNVDEVNTYIRFINDLNHPIEFWVDEGDCFYYDQEDFSEGGSVSENLNNILEFTYSETYGDIEYVEIVTVTVSGNTMVVKYVDYENGEIIESGSVYFSKSTENVDDFTLCTF